jgi:hypothetical protein
MEKPIGIRLCSVDGCDRKHTAKGFCKYHYQKDRLLSSPETREKNRQSAKNYYKRDYVRAKIKQKNQSKNLIRGIKNIIEKDTHAICKELGKPINYVHSNPDYSLRCAICNVSFSINEPEILYKNNKCPCCHRLLRARLGTRKKKQNDLLRRAQANKSDE